MTEVESIEVDCIVIGAGVIGLAVARLLSERHEVLVLERHARFGEETSSRNSEVVHSGLYYPKDSKKTRWCLEGRRALYDFCDKHTIPYKKCGKYLVAVNESEVAYLNDKAAHCKSLDVPHSWVTRAMLEKQIPSLDVEAALFFPETGIIDSHTFLQTLEAETINRKGTVLYRQRVQTVIHNTGRNTLRTRRPWIVEVLGPDGPTRIEAETVVNCGGLGAAELSNAALGVSRFEHRFCRGRYFSVSGPNPFSNLVYPCPSTAASLGIHVTVDLAGGLRLGPDADWCNQISYDCDWETLRPVFAMAVRRYWPKVDEAALQPGLIGIRPKLFVDGVAYPDFLVEKKDGFVHCLGIESPGLTASLAIAENVLSLVEER